MAPSRGTSFEGQLFFVYDREAVKREQDPPEDAILYFYPPSASVESRVSICGQLVGMSNFLMTVMDFAPVFIKMEKEKVALHQSGQYTLALGGGDGEPESLIIRQLDALFSVFSFYHGSFEHVRKLSKNHSSFLSNLTIIWDCYLPFIRYYGDTLPAVFDPLPFLKTPKNCSGCFLKASHILQACQRRHHILGGCILYKKSVLCTQLEPCITKRLLLIKPNQSHHPATQVKTDINLPFGVRILHSFVTVLEYERLIKELSRSPYRQSTNNDVTNSCLTWSNDQKSDTHQREASSPESSGEKINYVDTIRKTSFEAKSGKKAKHDTSKKKLQGELAEKQISSDERKLEKDGFTTQYNDTPSTQCNDTPSTDHDGLATQCNDTPSTDHDGLATQCNDTPSTDHDGLATQCNDTPSTDHDGLATQCNDTLSTDHDALTTQCNDTPSTDHDGLTAQCNDTRSTQCNDTPSTDHDGLATQCNDIPSIDHDGLTAQCNDTPSTYHDGLTTQCNDTPSTQCNYNTTENISRESANSYNGTSLDEDFENVTHITCSDSYYGDAGEEEELIMDEVDVKDLRIVTCHETRTPRTSLSEDRLEVEMVCYELLNDLICQVVMGLASSTIRDSTTYFKTSEDLTVDVSPREDDNTDILNLKRTSNDSLLCCSNQEMNATQGEMSINTDMSKNAESAARTVCVGQGGVVNGDGGPNRRGILVSNPHKELYEECGSSNVYNGARRDLSDMSPQECGSPTEYYEARRDLYGVSPPEYGSSNEYHGARGRESPNEYHDSLEDLVPDGAKSQASFVEKVTKDILESYINMEKNYIAVNKYSVHNLNFPEEKNLEKLFFQDLVDEGKGNGVAAENGINSNQTQSPDLTSFRIVDHDENHECGLRSCETNEDRTATDSIESCTRGCPGDCTTTLGDSGISSRTSLSQEETEASDASYTSVLRGQSDDCSLVSQSIAVTNGRQNEQVNDHTILDDEEENIDDEGNEENYDDFESNQVDEMVHINLYVQAHSNTVLILLAEARLHTDHDTIKALWKTSLNELGELEVQLNQRDEIASQDAAKTEDYSYLVYDGLNNTTKGNLNEPVQQVDHMFCDTAKTVHEQFKDSSSLRSVTLRNASSAVHCQRSLSQEVYFHKKGFLKSFTGSPSSRDPAFSLEKRACKLLHKDHDVNVF